MITSSSLQFIFFFLCAFMSSRVLSRTVDPIPKTSVFYVSASIQKAAGILFFNPETMQEQESQQQSISSLATIKLYSRDTLAKSPFKTYRDLTLSRLEHDSARVNFLYNKLHAALEGGSKKSDLTSPMDFDAPVTSGASQGVGAYFARFGFGTPSKQLYTSIDTGSDITWIPCSPCEECSEQNDPIFDPSMSSSYKPLPFDTQICREIPIFSGRYPDGTCMYAHFYADGSYSIGQFAMETLTIGNSINKDIAIGCAHSLKGFHGSAGLFGLGGGLLSFPSQTKTSSFSYCLVDLDSTSASTLDFGSVVEGVTAQLLRNNKFPTFYYVGLTGISVGGQMLPISPSVFAIDPSSGDGGVIVDSGTTLTLFPIEVYNALRDQFVNGTHELKSAHPFDPYDTCFDINPNTSISVPDVEFRFGQKSLKLPTNNYMRLVDIGIVCLAFQPTGESMSLIGNFQQQGMRVTYDVGNSLIGFSPNKC